MISSNFWEYAFPRCLRSIGRDHVRTRQCPFRIWIGLPAPMTVWDQPRQCRSPRKLFAWLAKPCLTVRRKCLLQRKSGQPGSYSCITVVSIGLQKQQPAIGYSASGLSDRKREGAEVSWREAFFCCILGELLIYLPYFWLGVCYLPFRLLMCKAVRNFNVSEA